MTILLQLLRDLLLAFIVPRTVLVAENLLLRHQVVVLRRQVKRPRLRPFDRWVLASIPGRLRDLLAAVFIVRPETVIRWHRTGLSESTIATFRALLYGPGPWLAFADLPTQLAMIPDERERIRLATVVMTAESYLARLRIYSTTDVERVVRYWDAAGQASAMRPLLEAVTRVSGGSTVSVLTFLPPLPRGQLNRYPAASDPIEAHSDCFWTSLNFFTDRPSDRVDDPGYVADALKTRYRPTGAAPKLGDLIVFFDDQGAPVHVAVYVADDFVFTKNGYGLLHPWTLMKVSSMVSLYMTLRGPLREITVAAANGD